MILFPPSGHPDAQAAGRAGDADLDVDVCQTEGGRARHDQSLSRRRVARRADAEQQKPWSRGGVPPFVYRGAVSARCRRLWRYGTPPHALPSQVSEGVVALASLNEAANIVLALLRPC